VLLLLLENDDDNDVDKRQGDEESRDIVIGEHGSFRDDQLFLYLVFHAEIPTTQEFKRIHRY
jgi:hypothetical protein